MRPTRQAAAAPESDDGGDERAEIERAYALHAAELVRFAALLVGPAQAEDVVADAVVSTLRSKRKRPVENWRAYFYRAVFHQAGTHVTRASRRRSLERRTDRPRREEQFEIDPAIRAAVERLSTRQRAVVLLAYWQDLTPRQISDLLDIGEGSVRRHLARARAALRKELHHE